MRRAIALVAVLLLVSTAGATWNDNFDSYKLGSINGQGGWEGWDGKPAAAGIVTNAMSRSPKQSQEIHTVADSIRQFSGYTKGTWEASTWMYIPKDFRAGGTPPADGSYFIMLNKYMHGGGANNRWSVQLAFANDGKIHADCGSTKEVLMPYVRDAWKEIKVKIYLDEDWTQVYYDGKLLDDPGLPNHPTLGGGYIWTKGVFGRDVGGLKNIACFDLFAQDSTSVYYDDMQIIPEPASCLLALAGLGLLRRR